MHAVGRRGTVPLGWALYLPREWCEDAERRRRAKIPEEVVFAAKPELALGLVERAAGWGIETAPVLGDAAYGSASEVRDALDAGGLEYVLAVRHDISVFVPETTFAPRPRRADRRGRPSHRLHPDRPAESVTAMIARLGPQSAQQLVFRDGEDGC